VAAWREEFEGQFTLPAQLPLLRDAAGYWDQPVGHRTPELAGCVGMAFFAFIHARLSGSWLGRVKMPTQTPRLDEQHPEPAAANHGAIEQVLAQV